MTHDQVCFTRLGGQGSGDGWQAVNGSAGLPAEATASFTRLQNGNIYPPTFDPEDANTQIVTELQIDGGFAFLTQIKYGLKDQTGRPAMFAHAYVFPLNEFVYQPQEVLAVTGDNFAFDVEATAVPRPALNRGPMLSLAEAVARLGLSQAGHTTLLQCVYFVLDSKAKNPLHILCDCSPQTIQGLMTCLLAALPYEFRRRVTYSTYENQNGTPKVIIFQRRKTGNGLFVDPFSGENNVLTDVLIKRWEKNSFMILPAQQPTANFDRYFRSLEAKLAEFGCAQTTSLDLYRLAYELEKDSKMNTAPTPDQLVTRLNDLLSVPVNHPFIDRQIESTLVSIVDNKIILNDILSEKLCRKLERTQDADLINAGHLYNTEKISQMTVEEGARYLYAAFEDRNTEAFLQIRGLLEMDAKGRDILSYLYNDLVYEHLPQTETAIVGFYEETRRLHDRGEIQRSLGLLCQQYLKNTIVSRTDPRQLLYTFDSLARQVLGDRPDLCAHIRAGIIKTYWNTFQYQDLSLTEPELYGDVLTTAVRLNDESGRARGVLALLELYQHFSSGDSRRFIEELNALFRGGERIFEGADQAVVIGKLQRACLDSRRLYRSYELDVWLALAMLYKLENRNPVQFLIDNQLDAMKNFESAFTHSSVLQDDITLGQFTRYLESYMESKPEGYKIAAEALRVIRDHEKTVRQEAKRQQKEQRQQQKGEGDKKNFFSGLKNSFKKKPDDDDFGPGV